MSIRSEFGKIKKRKLVILFLLLIVLDNVNFTPAGDQLINLEVGVREGDHYSFQIQISDSNILMTPLQIVSPNHFEYDLPTIGNTEIPGSFNITVSKIDQERARDACEIRSDGCYYYSPEITLNYSDVNFQIQGKANFGVTPGNLIITTDWDYLINDLNQFAENPSRSSEIINSGYYNVAFLNQGEFIGIKYEYEYLYKSHYQGNPFPLKSGKSNGTSIYSKSTGVLEYGLLQHISVGGDDVEQKIQYVITNDDFDQSNLGLFNFPPFDQKESPDFLGLSNLQTSLVAFGIFTIVTGSLA
ncbi:MAG: hypothetical protein IH840_18210, partial [Candidatus Heimdallarchaeota archaeon]|nr:hypothetical protein [Candidatus Heimdallarchaeota archaeon]